MTIDDGQWILEHDTIIMKGLNKVQLIGNLGKDPEINLLEGNIQVAKFTLATTETYRNKTGELITDTEWHNIVLWRGLAEIAAKYLVKGSMVYIEGKIKTRHYDDKEGVRKYVTEIVADEMIMLEKKTDNEKLC